MDTPEDLKLTEFQQKMAAALYSAFEDDCLFIVPVVHKKTGQKRALISIIYDVDDEETLFSVGFLCDEDERPLEDYELPDSLTSCDGCDCCCDCGLDHDDGLGVVYEDEPVEQPKAKKGFFGKIFG